MYLLLSYQVSKKNQKKTQDLRNARLYGVFTNFQHFKKGRICQTELFQRAIDFEEVSNFLNSF